MENRIFINNCYFDSLNYAIEITTGGVLGKKAIANGYKHNILTFDCRNNYFGTIDTTIIDTMIIDIKDDSLYNAGLQQMFVSECTYIPFELETITQKHKLVLGIRYNNFINCNYAIVDAVRSYITFIRSHQILKNFKLNAQIYPNPFNSFLSIKILNIYKQTEYKLKVFNINGEEIQKLRKNGILTEYENVINLNFNNLSSGIYFIKIFTENSVITKRCFLLK
ncbi:T9SS type A sorting domain-containing protein [Calditrichota bacterium GD2]